MKLNGDMDGEKIHLIERGYRRGTDTCKLNGGMEGEQVHEIEWRYGRGKDTFN